MADLHATSVVLVNGIDDHGESRDPAMTRARARVFEKQFPKAEVLIFDSFCEGGGALNEGYLRNRAKDIIKRLQRSNRASKSVGSPVPVSGRHSSPTC